MAVPRIASEEVPLHGDSGPIMGSAGGGDDEVAGQPQGQTKKYVSERVMSLIDDTDSAELLKDTRYGATAAVAAPEPALSASSFESIMKLPLSQQSASEKALISPDIIITLLSWLPSVVDVCNFCSINKTISCYGPAEKKRRQDVLRATFLMATKIWLERDAVVAAYALGSGKPWYVPPGLNSEYELPDKDPKIPEFLWKYPLGVNWTEYRRWENQLGHPDYVADGPNRTHSCAKWLQQAGWPLSMQLGIITSMRSDECVWQKRAF